MANYLGPLTTIIPHVRDEDNINRDGSEVINLVCNSSQAKQIEGLCEDSVKTVYGPLRVVTGNQGRWGLMPVNTSENLKVNESQAHYGLYQLKNVNITELNPVVFLASIEAEMLSRNMNEILTIMHSLGGDSGGELAMNRDFSDNDIETILDEEFTTFDTVNIWHPKYAENMASSNIQATGDKLVFTGASSTNWTWGYNWTVLRETLPEDLTAEFTLEWNALPSSGQAHHQFNLFLMDGRPANKTEYEYKDVIRIVLEVQSTGAVISVDKRVRGQYSNVTSDIPLSSVQKTPALKIKLTGRSGLSNLTVWLDKDYSGGTPNYSKIFGSANTGVNFDLGRYLLLSFENASSTSATCRCSFLDIYNTIDALKPNTVIVPVGATLDQTPTFYRASEYGNIPCIKNPETFPTYQITPSNFYNGSVKGMNGNYSDNIYRQVTWNEVDLDPTKFYLSNGLVKLVTTSNGVEFHYWNGTAYTLLNTFTLPSTIKLIRPFLVTPWMFTLQLDRTLWTMKAGKPHIWVAHEDTSIGFTRKSCYYHDGITTTDPLANTDITMQSQFYTNIWSRGTGTCASPNPADRYRLQIMSQNPRTIKSDSIPASPLTGIGFYDSNIAVNSDDSYLYRAREWFKPTWQKIILESVI